MNEIELKSILHERIENITDINFLEGINKLLEEKYPEIAETKVPHYILEIIRSAEAEIDEGRYYTNEEVEKEIDEWLNE